MKKVGNFSSIEGMTKGAARTLSKGQRPKDTEAVCSYWAADKVAVTLCKFLDGWQMLWHIQRNKKSSFVPHNSIGRSRYPG